MLTHRIFDTLKAAITILYMLLKGRKSYKTNKDRQDLGGFKVTKILQTEKPLQIIQKYVSVQTLFLLDYFLVEQGNLF